MAGRPKANRTNIVPVDRAMPMADIRVGRLWGELVDTEASMSWLASRRLLSNTLTCAKCNNLRKLQNYRKGIDGKRWSCEPCDFRKSIREGSFFSRSHLSLKQIVLLVYCWVQDMPQNLTMREAEVDRENTVTDWFNFCREDAGRYLDMTFTELGGFDNDGNPIIVEIDESKYFHRKYHRGQWTEGHWVFGGVERGSGRCFLVAVPNRTADVLEPLILQHVLPGTHIISDGWASYRNLSTLAYGIYQHSVIVHEENFVRPDDPEVRTQNIENLWMRAKRKLQRQFGTSRALFTSYLRS